MGVLGPTTRFTNRTERRVVLVTEDEFKVCAGEKSIGPGRHVDVGYRRGIHRIGPRVHYWVHPENRSDLRGPTIMPIDVFEFGEIEVVYKLGDGSVSDRYRIGALVGFEFKRGTMFRRIGLVRWFGGIFFSLAQFGSCKYSPVATASASVQYSTGDAHVLPQVSAPSHPDQIVINGVSYL